VNGPSHTSHPAAPPTSQRSAENLKGASPSLSQATRATAVQQQQKEQKESEGEKEKRRRKKGRKEKKKKRKGTTWHTMQSATFRDGWLKVDER